MKVRLGYACISETLNVTSSSTYTYTNFCKERNYEKLELIIKSNLLSLKEIITYNVRNNIHFFRMSSNLIPLATRRDVEFDYFSNFKDIYDEIGMLISNNKIRTDFHPGEFCVLNSIHSDVVSNSIDILNYHYNLLKYFSIDLKLLILHIGSLAFGKENSIDRFCCNFKRLDLDLQKCIAIENDDRLFNVDDCIEIYNRLDVPIVFDYHHHICNKGKLDFDEFIKIIFMSWKGDIPKIHFSSPKSKINKEKRFHNDYINSDAFIQFIELVKVYNQDIDIMIEAKKKDEALFRLVRELKYKTNYTFIDDTSFVV